MLPAELLAALADRLGPEAISTESSVLRYHAQDGLGPARGVVGTAFQAAGPAAVVFPSSTADVAAVLQLATAFRVPVVPYGGGTGLMGGARSPLSGLVLDLARMNRVQAVSRVDRTATVQAGIVLEQLEIALAAEGLMLAHDPWTVPAATIGGTIATDGVGYRAGRYGSMGSQVLGLEAVLPDGRALRTRAVPHRSVGFDPTRLFIGSEGTFGVITEATLRLYPCPEARNGRLFRFPDFETGFAAVLGIFDLGLEPSALDYGDERVDDETTEGDGERTVLVIFFEGLAEVAAGQMARATAVCRTGGGVELPAEEADVFWAERHTIARRFAEARRRGQTPRPVPVGQAFDFVHVALQPGQVVEFRRRALALAASLGVVVDESGIWTHPGLFSMTLFHHGGGHEPATVVVGRAVEGLIRLAHSFGGSMEYCHGVGLRLAPFMAAEHGETGLAVLRALKHQLDPAGILNPGKLGLDREGR